jgi:cytochrome c oxidase cbb3-type subunit I/II
VKNLRQDPEFVKNYGDANIQDKEITALIAYLQRLGTDIKGEQTAQN